MVSATSSREPACESTAVRSSRTSPFSKTCSSHTGSHARSAGNTLEARRASFHRFETWPELWLLDGSQVEQARQLVQEALEPPKTTSSWNWTCPECREDIESQFSEWLELRV